MASVVAPTPSPRRGDESRRWRMAPTPSPRRLLDGVQHGRVVVEK